MASHLRVADWRKLPSHHRRTAAYTSLTPAAFQPLHGLAALRSLGISGTSFSMSGGEWCASLRGLPRPLQRLAIGSPCSLPPNAFAVAGACCRRLTELELHTRGDFSAATLKQALDMADNYDTDDNDNIYVEDASPTVGNEHSAPLLPRLLFPELRQLRLVPRARSYCGNA